MDMTLFFYLKFGIFVLGSAALVWVSRPALRSVKAHGFYRFFAWEAILILLLLNIDFWYVAPFAPHQLIAWLLLFSSLFLVIHGMWLLRQLGRPDRNRDDPSLLGLEKTTQLVTSGAYRYIRHPLYSSLLFLAWGTFFKHPSWLGMLLAGLATLFLALTARIEEAENRRFFGPAYDDYIKHTKMFVPFLF